jgi:aminoacrylate hydrolase
VSTTLRFDVQGQQGPQVETILLSSGLGGAAAFWLPQLPRLAARYRVITYDHRGTGRNAQPLDEGHRIDDMADDVVAILDQAGVERCHLVGHALGGLIGLSLALRHQHRLQSLAVVNGWASGNAHTRRCFDARLHLLASAGAQAYCEAQPLFLYPPAWSLTHQARIRAEVAHALENFPGEANVRARIAALLAFEVADRLGHIELPVLLSASRDDFLVPWTCSQALAEALPCATLDIVEGGGHAMCATQPDAFNGTLLHFLARHACTEIVS